MHLEPGLLLLPYRNRWSRKPVGRKAAMSGALLAASLLPVTPVVPAVCGVVAGVLACKGARVSLHVWLELLAAPLLFTAIGSAIAAGGNPENYPAALAALARGFGGASATMLLAATTPPMDLIAFCQRRRGCRTLAELLLLSFRAAVALGQSGLAMVTALRIRGLGQSWQTAPRVYSLFAGALAVRSLQQAQRAEAGMAVRGFDGSPPLIGPEEAP